MKVFQSTVSFLTQQSFKLKITKANAQFLVPAVINNTGYLDSFWLQAITVLICSQAIPLPFCLEDEGKRTPEILLYASSARSPESGLLSDWLKNKRSFRALHQLVTSNISDFRCN